MDEFQLLIDLHKNANRQGPGGDDATEKAIALADVDRNAPLKIADIGCGTGASTLVLANLLNAKITAVDFLQDFLDVLETRVQHGGVAEKITTRNLRSAPTIASRAGLVVKGHATDREQIANIQSNNKKSSPVQSY